MKRWVLAAAVTSFAACGSGEPPPEAPDEPDGGVIGEAYLDTERRAQEAVDAAAERKRDLDDALERAEGRGDND